MFKRIPLTLYINEHHPSSRNPLRDLVYGPRYYWENESKAHDANGRIVHSIHVAKRVCDVPRGGAPDPPREVPEEKVLPRVLQQEDETDSDEEDWTREYNERTGHLTVKQFLAQFE